MKDDPRVRAPETSDPLPAWQREIEADNERWVRAQRRGRRIAGALLPFYVVAVLVVVWTAESPIVVGALLAIFGYQWLLPYLTHRWYRKISINPPDEPSGD